MVSSGIQSLLEIIYAEHTVPHILSGKTFSSETRYHLTTADMLYALLIGNIHNINFELSFRIPWSSKSKNGTVNIRKKNGWNSNEEDYLG